MAAARKPKLVLSPEVRAIINLDPGNIIGCLKSHVSVATRHFGSGQRSDLRTTCSWHGQAVNITTSCRGRSLTTRVRFASEG